MSNRIASVALALSLSLVGAARAGAQITPGTAPGTFVGPSSTQTPYVVPTAPGWETIAVISAGDPANNGYRMVGIPDGLGALAGRFESGRYVADEKYMTVFMNHETPAPNGIVRAHGQNSAFVSQWTIRLNSLRVRFGEDLIQNVFTWDAVNHMYVTASASERQFSRFCSADLPASTAFFNPRTRKGFGGRLFMNGEESGVEGRAFAHVLTGHDKGSSYQLASLGRFSWENSVAHPHAGDKTIVVGLDDSTPGQVYVYVGDKKSNGHAVERAGLVGGRLSGIQVTNGGANYGNGPVTHENNGPINGTFQLVDVSDVAAGPGATLQSTSVARHISEFARPEDGAWDTRDPRVFYFVVTGASIDGQGQSARLYKLRFDSIANPTGGTIELIIDRASLHAAPLPAPVVPPAEPLFAQFDNITVAGDGSVLVQEDPGNVPYISRTWLVHPAAKTATEILHSDPSRFAPPTPPPFNQDEESSGIIEVTNLVRSARWFEHNRRYFLADLQAHYLTTGDPELFEGGQLYLIASPRHHGHAHDRDDHDRDDGDDRGDGRDRWDGDRDDR